MPLITPTLVPKPHYQPGWQPAIPAPPGLRHAQLLCKRLLDVSLALLLLLLCAPLALVLSLWIRLTSPGPALFRQTRVGFRGRHFVLYKFRSMRLSSDDAHRAYALRWIHGGEDARQPNGTFKLAGDCRITPIGRFLRKYSLDELPQLLNVLIGDMSLVGPRPAMSYEVANYEPWHRQRLNLPPGLTGLWQVSGRNQLPFERMVELDLEYLRTWSLRSDLRILLSTVSVVLRGTGR